MSETNLRDKNPESSAENVGQSAQPTQPVQPENSHSPYGQGIQPQVNPYSERQQPMGQQPMPQQYNMPDQQPGNWQNGQQPPVYPNPEPNRQYPPIKPGYAEVKKVQNLALAASICGPVSVFIGGMLLSGIGVVCGFLGMRRADRIEKADKDVQEAAARARRSCVVALIVCAVAFSLNAAYSFYMYPIIMDAVQTGDLSALMGNAASSGSIASGGSGSSTWG